MMWPVIGAKEAPALALVGAAALGRTQRDVRTAAGGAGRCLLSWHPAGYQCVKPVPHPEQAAELVMAW